MLRRVHTWFLCSPGYSTQEIVGHRTVREERCWLRLSRQENGPLIRVSTNALVNIGILVMNTQDLPAVC